jgi:hypothetical protein
MLAKSSTTPKKIFIWDHDNSIKNKKMKWNKKNKKLKDHKQKNKHIRFDG